MTNPNEGLVVLVAEDETLVRLLATTF